MSTYAYIRVSTDKQDLDSQRHGVIEYAKRHGLEPLAFFEDTASGKKDWRDRDIAKLLAKAGRGDVLLVSEFSRLGRSTLQVLEITKLTAEKGITVHIVKNNLIMDGSLNAKMAAVIFGFVSEMERDFISARTTEALARRKAEGKPVGRQKGSKNKDKLLDKHRDQIVDLLQKEVHKTSIARIVNCDPDTLYDWMRSSGLGGYIKSRKGEPDAKPEAALGSKKGGDPASKTVAAGQPPAKRGRKPSAEGAQSGQRA